MTEEEIKEWDDALLDLINKGLIETIENEKGDKLLKLRYDNANY